MSPRARQRTSDPVVARLAEDAVRIRALRTALCAWYAASKRDLPWRRTSDAYAIWISEAMLQQTRVEAALEPYARFLERFPTVEALAAASEDDVVAQWSGLGYYNRARTLRRAAIAIVEGHGGRFPADVEAARGLPGVGDYTVGAVLSIAYGLGVPLVDGNVARVFARLFALHEPVDRGPTQRTLWGLAEQLVPGDHDDPREAGAPGSWNQALMELGATVCTPRSPRCLLCPLQAHCLARAEGSEGELPKKTPKPPPLDVDLELFVVRRDASVLFVRRPSSGRMAGMWELPTRERAEGREGLLWPTRPTGPAGLVRPLAAGEDAVLATLRHGITRHRITARMVPGSVETDRLAQEDATGWAWIEPDAPDVLSQRAWTGLARKALRALSGGISGDARGAEGRAHEAP